MTNKISNQSEPKTPYGIVIVLRGFTFLEKLTPWASSIAIIYLLSPFLIALVGEKTAANFQIGLIMGKNLIHWPICFFVGAMGIIYGWRQSSLRRKNIASLEGQARKFEESVDPERTSSRLTKKGKTNPKDK